MKNEMPSSELLALSFELWTPASRRTLNAGVAPLRIRSGHFAAAFISRGYYFFIGWYYMFPTQIIEAFGFPIIILHQQVLNVSFELPDIRIIAQQMNIIWRILLITKQIGFARFAAQSR